MQFRVIFNGENVLVINKSCMSNVIYMRNGAYRWSPEHVCHLMGVVLSICINMNITGFCSGGIRLHIYSGDISYLKKDHASI